LTVSASRCSDDGVACWSHGHGAPSRSGSAGAFPSFTWFRIASNASRSSRTITTVSQRRGSRVDEIQTITRIGRVQPHPVLRIRPFNSTFRAAGRVADAMHRAGIASGEIKAFYDSAGKGDRNHFIRVASEWVTLI
jgi:hypothetical protein